MEELLVFSDNKTGEKVGMYYNAWLFIIRCILVKYGHKTAAEADEILKKHYYKILLSAKHSVLHPNSLPHCSLDDFMLVTSPLFVFCYPWR
jgi:hypothetical protein